MVKSVSRTSLASVNSVISRKSSRSSLTSNVSVLSNGSQGPGFETSIKKRNGLFGKKKFTIGRRKKKDKISKHDFYNKTPEFRMWLLEEKSLSLDELADGKAKELFKKFVKKWNSRKLAQKYYVGTDPMWSVASPSSYSRVTLASDEDTLVADSDCTSPGKSPTPSNLSTFSGFSTFGKRAGLRFLRERKSPRDRSTPKAVAENIYDEVIFGPSVKKAKGSFASPVKSVPLSQLFQNQEREPVSSQSRVCTPVANPSLPCTGESHYAEPFTPPFPSPPPPEDLVIPGPTFVAPAPPPLPDSATSESQTESTHEPPIYATVQKRPLTRSRSRESVKSRNKEQDSSSIKMPPPPPPRKLHSSDFNLSVQHGQNAGRLTDAKRRESISSISSVVSEPAYNTSTLGSSCRSENLPRPSQSAIITRSRSRESVQSDILDLAVSLPLPGSSSFRYGSEWSLSSDCSSMSQSSRGSQGMPAAGSPARLPSRGRVKQGTVPPPPNFARSADIKRIAPDFGRGDEVRRYASIRKKRPSMHLAKSLEHILSKELSANQPSTRSFSKEDLKKYKKGSRYDLSWSKNNPVFV